MSQVETELTCYGLSENPDQPLLVTDLYLPPQVCSPTSTEVDGEDLQEFFDEMVDRGLHPTQFARIWIHTHPKMTTTPSATDYRTLDERLGNADWMVMAIASGEKMTATLQTNKPFEIRTPMDVKIDWTQPFSSFDPRKALRETVKISELVTINCKNYPRHFDYVTNDLLDDVSYGCSDCPQRFKCAAFEPYCTKIDAEDKAFLAKLRTGLETKG